MPDHLFTLWLTNVRMHEEIRVEGSVHSEEVEQ